MIDYTRQIRCASCGALVTVAGIFRYQVLCAPDGPHLVEAIDVYTDSDGRVRPPGEGE